MGGGAVETRDSNDNMLEGEVKYWNREEVVCRGTTVYSRAKSSQGEQTILRRESCVI